jgi:tRNA A37 threonylcarbamoyladenosine modification protein TsaB
MTLSSPIQIGVYSDDILIETVQKDGKTSDVLPLMFANLLKKYKINNIVYLNGPGSYMAIKVAYIFLKTISIVNNISFQSSSAFNFNKNSPIKSLGKKYFIKDENSGEIIITNLENKKLVDFALPKKLNRDLFSDETLPNYHLPAV